MTTIIYGASDDLIEIDGRFSNEFPAFAPTQSTPAVVELTLAGGGTAKVTAWYDTDGCWRLNTTDLKNVQRVSADGADAADHVLDLPGIDNPPGYSDVLIINHQVIAARLVGDDA